MGPGLAELLSLPFRIVAPEALPQPAVRLSPKGRRLDEAAVRAALDSAIDHASTEFPSLRMQVGQIELASVAQFLVSFNAQLQDQVLDPASKRAAKTKPTAKANAAGAKRPTTKPVAEPDWRAMEDAIVAAGTRAAYTYAKQHGAAAALVLDTDPYASYVLFSFETAAGLIAHALGHYRAEAKRRTTELAGKYAWKEAAARAPQLADAISPGDFEHMDFDRVDFGEALARLAADPACPEPPAGGERYAAAQFRVVLTRALDRLVAQDALDVVIGDAPLLVGYTFHEERPVVLHVLAKENNLSKHRTRGPKPKVRGPVTARGSARGAPASRRSR
jgi:hypothetical protein